MIDLIAQIFFSALFAVGVRWVQVRRRYEVLSVGAVNYLVAFACGIVTLLLASGAGEGSTSGLRAGSPALLTAAALGLSYFVAFFPVLRTLDLRGATVTTALSRLAVLAPIALAVALWGERPGAVQWLGIAVSVGAVFLMNAPRRSSGSPGREVGWAIPLVFFVVAGGAFASQETFNHVAQPADTPLFLVAGFAVTAAGSLVLLAARRIRPTGRELAAGLILGVANAAQAFVSLRDCLASPSRVVAHGADGRCQLRVVKDLTGLLFCRTPDYLIASSKHPLERLLAKNLPFDYSWIDATHLGPSRNHYGGTDPCAGRRHATNPPQAKKQTKITRRDPDASHSPLTKSSALSGS